MSLKTDRDLNPANRDRFSRAKTAAQTKNYDYAITLLQSLLKEEPLFLDGRRFLRAVEIQKYKGLTTFNRQMLGMKVSGAAMKLGSAGKKPPGEQMAAAEEVLELDPFHTKANALIGEAGVALGYPDFKAFAYETLAEGKPTDKAALNLLAQTYMEMKQAEKAEKTFQRILEIDPRDGDALSGLKNASAAHASRSGGWEKKGGDYRDSLRNKGEAVSLEQSSKVVKSAEAIEEQIALNFKKHEEQPDNPLHSKAIASLFVQKDDYASAIQWYEHAFEAGKRIDTSLEKTIGDLKLQLADQELQQLRDTHAQQTDPETQAQYQAAIEQKEQEGLQVRLELAEARVRAYPNDGQYHYELGEVLFKVGQYKRALQELQLGQKQPSLRYHALNLMGQCFMRQGMTDLAIKRLQDAEGEMTTMDDLKKEIVYNLGLAYDANQQPEKGLEQYKKIYEVDMSYRDVATRVEASYG